MDLAFEIKIGPNQIWFLKLGLYSCVVAVEIWRQSDATLVPLCTLNLDLESWDFGTIGWLDLGVSLVLDLSMILP